MPISIVKNKKKDLAMMNEFAKFVREWVWYHYAYKFYIHMLVIICSFKSFPSLIQFLYLALYCFSRAYKFTRDRTCEKFFMYAAPSSVTIQKETKHSHSNNSVFSLDIYHTRTYSIH